MVIYDRMRENLRKYRKMAIIPLINLSLNETLSRTIVTSLSIMLALAVLLLLGARKGKYGGDGKPRPIPGHSMPLFGLGVLILWLGWFGFNPGSTLGAIGNRFAEVVVVTNLAAAAGVIAAVSVMYVKSKTIDIGMAGNGAIGALVAITAPSGYVEPWTAPIIGAIAGVIVPLGVYAIDNKIDDPVGALEPVLDLDEVAQRGPMLRRALDHPGERLRGLGPPCLCRE